MPIWSNRISSHFLYNASAQWISFHTDKIEIGTTSKGRLDN